MEARCFDSCGQLNSLSPQFKTKSPHQRLTLDKDNQTLLLEDDAPWSPKGIMSIIDSLTAIKFCWILVGLGHEMDIEAYITWWIHLFRSKMGKIEELKLYWIEASWKMALEMRQHGDFAICSCNVMEDTASLQSALLKDQPRSKGAGKTQNKPANARGRTNKSDRRPWSQPQWQNKRHHSGDDHHQHKQG
eukprot:Skav229269  [mRNA]  locus=scaffold952:184886:185455:- [translate_table: standard]